MQIDRQEIITALEAMGQHETAQKTGAQLPDQVDTEQHAGLLSQLGVDVPALLQHLNGPTS